MNLEDLKKRIGGLTRVMVQKIQDFSQKTIQKAKASSKSSDSSVAQESSFKQPPEHLRQRQRGTVSEQEIKSFLEDYLEKPAPSETDSNPEKPV